MSFFFVDEDCHGLGLKFGYGIGSCRDVLSNKPLAGADKRSTSSSNISMNVSFSPVPTVKTGVSSRPSVQDLFHRDAQGRVAFTFEEAEAASKFILNLGLDTRVKDCKFGHHVA